MPTFEERFRKLSDWCSKNGFVAGFPTCHENTNVSPALYGAQLFTQGASWQDVPRSTLGNPPDARRRLTSAHDYAKTNGFGHGFPNFHEANYGAGVVYGTFLITTAATTWQDVPVSDTLGSNIDPTTRPLEEWFRGVHDWSQRTGKNAAMPNGHYAKYGTNWVMGVISFPAAYVQFRDLTAAELGFPVQLKVGPSWP